MSSDYNIISPTQDYIGSLEIKGTIHELMTVRGLLQAGLYEIDNDETSPDDPAVDIAYGLISDLENLIHEMWDYSRIKS